MKVNNIKYYIFLLTFFANLNCVLYTDFDESYRILNDETDNIIPFFEGTVPISTAAPEKEMWYDAAGVKFNWAREDIAYFNVLISSDLLYNNEYDISNKEVIVASTDSTYTEADGNSMGYLGGTAFYVFQNGQKTSTPFTFTTGKYFWVVLGYSESGELTHSSAISSFYIN